VRAVTVFLCGDVMPGRGVDQILSHSGDPTLHEQYVRDARQYVELAQLKNGPIPYPVGDLWPWGSIPSSAIGGGLAVVRALDPHRPAVGSPSPAIIYPARAPAVRSCPFDRCRCLLPDHDQARCGGGAAGGITPHRRL
jgi:hypothetical protein